MKGCGKFLAVLSFVLGLISFAPKVHAQFLTIVSATASASSVPITNTLTYTIVTTNTSGAQADVLFITNTFNVQFSTQLTLVSFSATNGVLGGVQTNADGFVFFFGQVPSGTGPVMSLTVRPNFVGTLSNRIDLAGTIGGGTNLDSTSLITEVTGNGTTNPPVAVTDLRVSFTPPADDVFVNDRITYTLTVSNASSTAANNVFLTNTLPAGVSFLTASPAQQSFSGSRLRFSLGTLTNLDVRTFHVTVQPSSPGNKIFTADVVAAGTTNSSGTNTATMSLPVLSFFTNEMVAVISDPTQELNGQIGLMEQRIILSNASPSSVDSARVMVSGLPSNVSLRNAVGTNASRPFVVYSPPLAAGGSVGLLLQFRVPSFQPFPLEDSDLDARAVTAFNTLPPANLGAAIDPEIFSIPGRILLKFPSTNGQAYIVIYSNPLGVNRRMARPPFTSSANQTYWLDYGPPATVSEPMGEDSRFYEVFVYPPQ